MIGSRELGYLKETALLVNVSRGPIIDEKSLFEALVSRRIAGAGIDTWYQYPDSPEARADTKPAGLPFEELDQVVLSPHRAADVVERDLIRVEELAVQLNQINAGNPPENVIRPATG